MTTLFDDVLHMRPQAVLYEVQRRLTQEFPQRFVMLTRSELFDPYRFVFDKKAVSTLNPDVIDVLDHWPDDDTPGRVTVEQRHRRETLTWEGRQFEVLTITLRENNDFETVSFIVGDTAEQARTFFSAVCAWCSSTRGEVLSFENGSFSRSEALYRQIQSASFDDLILAPELASAVRDDVRRFVAAKETYTKLRVPWKRGLLLLGAPGNGKTHMLRALVRETGWQCLYVRSFRSRQGDAERGISQVFSRARRAAPCVVVLEDLDCLVGDENRSVLLNELDGFAQNEGLLVIATTNHPEKLDRSLLDRPSRFDRKFHFPLPEPRERRAYLERWRATLEPALHFDDDALTLAVEGTHGFTFAYLKELTFAAMMAFVDAGASMEEVLPTTLAALRGEMSSARKLLPPLPGTERKISLSA